MKSFLENLDDESKKRIKIFGVAVVVFILLIIVIAIIVAIVNRKTSYEEMEDIMAKAAYKYYEDNKGQLPTEEVKTTVVSAQTLVEKEYMKPISKYTKDESCSGNVVVTYKDGEYFYQPFLTCNGFVTSLLIDKLKKDNQVVASGDGLYDEAGVLRFRGEYVNNYLKLDGFLYRIIKIDSDNKVYITPDFLDDNDESIYLIWDNRYNTESDTYSGINDYSLSRIKKSLNSLYDNFGTTVKSNTVKFSTCIGKRGFDDQNNGVECNVFDDSYISLIPTYEYIKASLAPACSSPSSKECANYNYLHNEDYSWWTATGSSENTDDIYYVSLNGEIDKERGDTSKVARFVLALKPDAVLRSGNGTKKSPYEIR
ncbi:MAG: hypothetical protein E7158_03315 [Firmicutes bacterium]|nr:hypothetical protein [Bacillota bacterium]